MSKGDKHSKNIHSSEKDLFFNAWELPHGGAKKQMAHKGFSSNLIGSLGCQEYWPYGQIAAGLEMKFRKLECVTSSTWVERPQ